MRGGSGRTPRRLAPPFLAALLALELFVVAVPGVRAAVYYFPMMYLNPGCAPSYSWSSVTVTGRNYEPQQYIHVYDEYTSYTDGPVVQADEWGNFTAVVQLDPNNFHTIWTTDNVTQYDITFSDFDLCVPAIKATPQCSDTGAGSISISGTGWHGGVSANISIALLDSTNTVVASTSKTAAVNWSTTLSPPTTLPSGEYHIDASQSYGGDSVIPAFNDSDRIWYTVPCPTASLSPTCGLTGTTDNDPLSITVTVANFVEAEHQLEIVYDPDGHPQEWVTDVSVDGSYVITPFRRSQGLYTVLVKQGWSNHGGSRAGTNLIFEQASAIFAEPCGLATPTPTPTATPPPTGPPTASPSPSPSPSPTSAVYQPTLSLDVTCGGPQIANDLPQYYAINVTGSGFAPATTVDITFDADGVPQVFSGAADFSGALSAVIMPAAVPDGIHRVVVYQYIAGGLPLQVEASFSVPCVPPLPVITSDITCGPVAPGVLGAYLMNLSGTGFFPGRVDIMFDALGPLPETTFVTADAQGSWVAAMTAGGRAPGLYQVIASQVVYGSATLVQASFPFVVACEGPQFRLQPDKGPPGFVVTVTGAGFPPETDLLLRWSRGIGVAYPLAVRTDSAGSFTRQILIFYGDFSGPRELTIEEAADPLALATLAPAAFNVTYGTVSPPFVVNGNPFAAPGATIVFRH